jgi:hypothetical protein
MVRGNALITLLARCTVKDVVPWHHELTISQPLAKFVRYLTRAHRREVIEGWAEAVTEYKWPRLPSILKKRAKDLIDTMKKSQEELQQAADDACASGLLETANMETEGTNIVSLAYEYVNHVLNPPTAPAASAKVNGDSLFWKIWMDGFLCVRALVTSNENHL